MGGIGAGSRRGGRGGRLVGIAVVSLAAVACSGAGAGPGGGELGVGPSSTTTATAATATALTTATTSVPAAVPTSPTTPVPSAVALVPVTQPAGWGPGDEGAGVATLEAQLAALGYFVGALDGRFDDDTSHAVMAFQKVNGLDRTGRATHDVVAAVAAATGRPAPLVPGGGFVRVEVDLDRQVLFLYEGDRLDTILNASTGNNQRFCSQGWCRRAVTPVGAFSIYEQRSGWETAPLGRLYNSQYFNGGIAIHGSLSVPAQAASHGCVRISMGSAEWFPDRLALGTPVYVVAAAEPRPAPLGLAVASNPDLVAGPAPAPATPPSTLGLLESLLAPRP